MRIDIPENELEKIYKEAYRRCEKLPSNYLYDPNTYVSVSELNKHTNDLKNEYIENEIKRRKERINYSIYFVMLCMKSFIIMLALIFILYLFFGGK